MIHNLMNVKDNVYDLACKWTTIVQSIRGIGFTNLKKKHHNKYKNSQLLYSTYLIVGVLLSVCETGHIDFSCCSRALLNDASSRSPSSV